MQNEPLPPPDGPQTTLTEPETAKQKFERERLTRRQALKKFGMTSAMATLALFSVDDLARMVGGALERQARNSKIAAQVAEEFQHAGIAVGAVMPNPSYYPYPNPSYYPYDTPPYYQADGSPAGNAGRAFGAACSKNPGVDKNGDPRNCIDCLRAACKAKYPNIGPYGIMVSQSYDVCVGAGNPNC